MADALFPRTKQRVLALLFGQPDRSFGKMELIGLARSGSGGVQRELDRLVASGLVLAAAEGRGKRYTANRDAPLFDELRGIVDKTSGVADTVRAGLASLGTTIHFAAIYGSVAKETDRATSDIDLLVVADGVTLEDVFGALQEAEERLGRRINPTLFSTDEFRNRRKVRHPFLTKLLTGKHVVVVGGEDAIPAR
jgi:predicted nucleotidyltransferase